MLRNYICLFSHLKEEVTLCHQFSHSYAIHYSKFKFSNGSISSSEFGVNEYSSLGFSSLDLGVWGFNKPSTLNSLTAQ